MSRIPRRRLTALALLLALTCLVQGAGTTRAVAGPLGLSASRLRDAIAGGWLGGAVGGAWGAPTEFRYDGRTIPARAVPRFSLRRAERYTFHGFSDESYVQLPFLEALRRYGAAAGWPEWSQSFARTSFRLAGANLRARQVIQAGVGAPASGDPLHNPYADDIDFQIEANFIGMATPAQPGAATEIAWRVGHVMGYGDGVYGGVMIAAMQAAAFRARSVGAIVDAGRRAVPPGTEYRQMIDDVIRWHDENPGNWRAAWRLVEGRWDSQNAPDKHSYLGLSMNADAKLNGAYVLLGLLYGRGRFERTIKIAMRAGQDSDCNPKDAASILGSWLGARGIPARFHRLALDRRFPQTSFTIGRAIRMNLGVAGALTAARGGRAAGRRWSIPASPILAPAFEQWDESAPPHPGPRFEASAAPAGRSVSFTVSASDPAGVRDVWWSFGDLSGAHGVSASHTYRAPGTYRVTVWLSDGDGATSYRELAVQVR